MLMPGVHLLKKKVITSASVSVDTKVMEKPVTSETVGRIKLCVILKEESAGLMWIGISAFADVIMDIEVCY